MSTAALFSFASLPWHQFALWWPLPAQCKFTSRAFFRERVFFACTNHSLQLQKIICRYFLLFSPMIRWLLIFVYRPEYDGGGLRWPLLHDMCISAMIMAQVCLHCFFSDLSWRLQIPLTHVLFKCIGPLNYNDGSKIRIRSCYHGRTSHILHAPV